eukprot:33911_1
MNLSEAKLLQIGDRIDFRANNGFVHSSTLVKKSDSKLTVEFEEFENECGIVWVTCDYNKELYRFSKHESISMRKSHRMSKLLVGNSVDINPKYAAFKTNKWICGEVVNKHFLSGQVLIECCYNQQKYLYWTHTDNALEISPYLTHIDTANINILKLMDETTNINDELSVLEKYKQLQRVLKHINNKNQLININNLNLQILGVSDENERKCILNDINHILYDKTEIDKLKQQVYLQQKEISFLKSRHNHV